MTLKYILTIEGTEKEVEAEKKQLLGRKLFLDYKDFDTYKDFDEIDTKIIPTRVYRYSR